MRFFELMERAKGRGVVVVPTPSSAAMAQGMPIEKVRPTPDPEITGICEDSRKTRPGNLFIGRTGTKTDGTKFIGDAISRGAVAIIVETPSPGIAIPGPTNSIALARVANANLAAAILAHELAGNPTAHMKMIGITGTKGKTTVAYLLRSVLKAAGHKVGMIGTVEIDDGEKTAPAEMTTPGAVELVEMLSRMQAHGVTHCVMEVSSHALHQHRVAGIDWAVAIFTNLTGDHLDYHKTMEEYAAAKAMLFEGMGKDAVAVANADDSRGRGALRMLYKCRARKTAFRVLPMTGPDFGPFGAVWTGTIRRFTHNGMQIEIRHKEELRGVIETSLVGTHNASNLMAVAASALELGIEPSLVTAALSSAKGAPGRLQRVEWPDKRPAVFEILVDYAHTHDALENVLSAVWATMPERQRKRKKYLGKEMGGEPIPGDLICVFGCGGDRDRTKRPKMGAVAERLADKVIVTSDNPRTESPAAIIEEICAGFSSGWKESGKITIEPDRRAAIQLAIGMARTGDVVLLAGKGHENYQIIGTTKHHFDDVEEAEAALRGKLATNEHE